MKKFAANPDVAFGDVNLRDGAVRTSAGVPQNPGAGGWPTIRYYNKDTGYGGAAYEKKTGMPMCEELGPKNDYMQKYVEEAGQTSLCSVGEGNPGCSEREAGYITKARGKTVEQRAKQLTRLQGMSGKKMAPKAQAWISQRIAILKQLTAEDAGGSEL